MPFSRGARWKPELPLLLLPVLVLGWTARVARSATVDVDAAEDFVAALGNPDVQTALLHSDVVLADGMFPQNSPIQLTRNLTILGAAPADDPDAWPQLDFANLKSKVQLGPYVFLTFHYVVLEWTRKMPPWQAPGLDFLTRKDMTVTLPIQSITSVTVMEDVIMIFQACLPGSDFAVSTTTIARPPQFPGTQQAHRKPPEAQAGCSNSTEASAQQRCWPAMGAYDDGALYAVDIDASGRPVQAGYIVRLHRAAYKCRTVLSEQCIAQYGSVVCFFQIVSAQSPSPPATPSTVLQLPSAASAPPGTLQVTGGGTNGTASSPAGNGVRFRAILGGVLGGAALLAIVAATVAVLYVRQHRRSSSCGTPHHGFKAASAGCGGPETARKQPPILESPCPRYSQRVFIQLHQEGAREFPSCCSCLPTGTPSSAGIALQQRGSPVSAQSEQQQQKLFASTPLDAAPTVSDDASCDGATTTASVQPTPLDVALVPVTALSPYQPGIDLCLHQSDEAVLQLSRVVLGKGSHGRVVEGEYLGARVAVKLLDFGLLPAGCTDVALEGGDSAQERHARTMKQEVEILARCQHPNIIRLLAANLSPQRVCLVMEMMDTSLDKMLHGSAGGLLPLPTVVHIMTQVALALSYLHPTILHRDVKPANILVSQPDSPRPVVKLADFGLGRLLDTVLVTHHPEAGTVPYMAPELFDVSNYVVTDRADVYAYAVVLWECLCGEHPWEEQLNVVAVAYNVSVVRSRPSLTRIPPHRLTPRLSSLFVACWQHDPARRPAAAELVKMMTLVAEGLAHGQDCEGSGG